MTLIIQESFRHEETLTLSVSIIRPFSDLCVFLPRPFLELVFLKYEVVATGLTRHAVQLQFLNTHLIGVFGQMFAEHEVDSFLALRNSMDDALKNPLEEECSHDVLCCL